MLKPWVNSCHSVGTVERQKSIDANSRNNWNKTRSSAIAQRPHDASCCWVLQLSLLWASCIRHRLFNISAVIYHQVHCAFSVLTLLTWHWSGTLKICYRNPKGFPRQTSGELSLTSGKEGKLGRQNTSQASVVCVVLQWTVQTRKATLLKWVMKDASVRPPHLSLASYDLDLWPHDLQSWSLHAHAPWSLVPTGIKIRVHSFSKYVHRL